MLPKHLSCVHQDRKAVAPYNFVELPDRIVTTDFESLPSGDQYHPNHLTGQIDCVLTTSSPLFIRCGLTPQQFEAGEEAKDKSEFFYTNSNDLHPVLPGSSLRGMLRTIVEIASFSKMTQVADVQKFFFRAVADSKTAVGKHYQARLNLRGTPSNVRAGYLERDEDNQLKIRPAKIVEEAYPFVWVKERLFLTVPQRFRVIPEYIRMGSENYQPQYYPNVYFGNLVTDSGRRFAGTVSRQAGGLPYQGALITSGDMTETGRSSANSTTKRLNHCLIGEPDESKPLLPICPIAIKDYCNGLTEFQKAPPFDPNWGILQEGNWIFYVKPQENQAVELFGHNPNFRIPFSWRGTGQAATVWDFLPKALRDLKPEELQILTPEEELQYFNQIDLAKAIFGFVRQEKQKDINKQARSGRVFFSDGIYHSSTDGLWYSNEAIIPKILSEPRPSTLSHYLVQNDQATQSDNNQKSARDTVENLQHYANQPERETVIRGHKLYWHQGRSPNFRHPDPADARANQATQITRIRPVNAGVTFKFRIDFENLTPVELGALLWVLEIAQDDRYRLSLGMGKPLGMGAVNITSTLHLSDRPSRYRHLFTSENEWYLGESIQSSFTNYVNQFKAEVVDQLHTTLAFDEIRRIKMLLALLTWKDALDADELNERRYLEIERPTHRNPLVLKRKPGTTQNEYAERRVLPTPLQVMRQEAADNLKEQTAAMLTERQVELRKAAKESGLKEGGIVTAEIVTINGREVTLAIAAQKLSKKNRRASQRQVGEFVSICITELRKDGTIKSFEFVEEQA